MWSWFWPWHDGWFQTVWYILVDLLGFSCTKVSRVHSEWCNNEKHPESGISADENVLILMDDILMCSFSISRWTSSPKMPSIIWNAPFLYQKNISIAWCFHPHALLLGISPSGVIIFPLYIVLIITDKLHFFYSSWPENSPPKGRC